MLYSDPTGSSLAAPPAVLVQGDAICPDQIVTRSEELDALGRLIMVRQPVSARYSANPLARWLSDWYLMRLLIYITPRRIRWWPHGDFSRPAAELQVPALDHRAQVLRVLVPDGLGMVPGPAGLLCHRHDEQLWRLKSFLLRGSLERTGHDWVFHPHRLVRGMDTTPVSNLRLLRDARRTARRYLATRGLRRPTIPWDHYARLKNQDSGTG